MLLPSLPGRATMSWANQHSNSGVKPGCRSGSWMPLELGGHTVLGTVMTPYSDEQVGKAGMENKDTKREQRRIPWT